MADNVIYGVDFKRALNLKVHRPATAEERELVMRAVIASSTHQYDIDTAPSEYTAPTDDCA